EEVKEVTSTLSVDIQSIKVTEVVKDGDTLTFLIESEKFPPLPVKAQVNASAKIIKQLGILGLGEWQAYCKAMETFVRQIAAHSILGKNNAVEIFLTSSDPPGRQRVRKNIFNRLSQAMEGMRKEGHKDVDEFFQTERDHNLVFTGCAKTAAERFLDVVQTEQKIAVACGHFSTALRLCVEQGEDPDKLDFSKKCDNVAENNVYSWLGLDLESRYQEAEKEMLYRRTCKLVELETTRRNAEKAKPVKKAAMEEVKKAAETEFDHISGVAKEEIARLQAARVKMLQQALVQWCEKQLLTAKESADQFNQHLQAFRGMA
ncbi:hypothetical protein F7725_017193, partial [Dissostichus mawsoni]